MQTTTRKRKQRRDTGTRLTDRDLLLLRMMGEQYALRFDQIQGLLGHYAKAPTLQDGMLSPSATRHAIDRWEAAGLVESQKILVDLPAFSWLTAAGLHAVDLPFRKLTPSPGQLEHIYWTAQTRLYIAYQYPEWSWLSERWLRMQADQKVKSVKVPDAHLQLPDNRTIAIEVELTAKYSPVLEQIIRDRTLVYGQVWYFTSKRTQKAVNSAVQHIDEIYKQRVKVYPLDILQGRS